MTISLDVIFTLGFNDLHNNYASCTLLAVGTLPAVGPLAAVGTLQAVSASQRRCRANPLANPSV